MLLTSQIKELGAILQKLIKFEPGTIPGRKMRQMNGLLAMRMNFGLVTSVVGSVQQRKRNVLTRTGNEKKKKESRLNSVKLVKRKIQSVINKYYNNKFMF